MMSKSEFIRSRPREMPVSQVIAEAAQVGLTLKSGLIHQVRSAERLARKKKKSSPLKGKTKPNSTKARVFAFVSAYLSKNGSAAKLTRHLIAKALDVEPEKVSHALAHLKADGSVSYPAEGISRIQVHLKSGHYRPVVETPVMGLLGAAPEYQGVLKGDLAKLLEQLEAKVAAVKQVITLLG